jgi:uncharacterized protein YbaP (TraB family)
MNFRSKIAALFASLSLAGCATVQPASTGAGPALWEISDHDTRIYLFGTIHLLPKGLNWRTPALERAIAESDELVIETVIGDNPAAQAKTMLKLGTNTPNLPPLVQRVPAEKREDFAKIMTASGVPAAALDRMETWVAALTLSAVSYKAMGLQADLGVEQGLSGRLQGEGAQDHRAGDRGGAARLFRSAVGRRAAPAAGQRARRPGRGQEAVRGDARDLEPRRRCRDRQDLRQGHEEDSGASRALLKRRNARWAQWLDKRMDRPGTVLVAVGAGHLAGSDSVQEMLRARGFKAKRLQ